MGINRRFGLVLVAACAVIYGWTVWSGSGVLAWLVAAVILLSITLTVPRVLEPLKELWLRFGWLLHVNELTGCPVLVNTSFNVRGEPIVCTPEDAFHCFMGTELDVLAIGNCVLRKEEQLPSLRLDYSNAFAPD
jgi:Carbamoyltransferase C-terminus